MALRKKDGTTLLAEFRATAEQFEIEAGDRGFVVKERLAELEAEQADLRQLQRQLGNALGTS